MTAGDIVDGAIEIHPPMPCFWCGVDTTRLDINWEAPFCGSEADIEAIRLDLESRA